MTSPSLLPRFARCQRGFRPTSDPSHEAAGRQHPVRVELVLDPPHEVEPAHRPPDVHLLLDLRGRVEDDDRSPEPRGGRAQGGDEVDGRVGPDGDVERADPCTATGMRVAGRREGSPRGTRPRGVTLSSTCPRRLGRPTTRAAPPRRAPPVRGAPRRRRCGPPRRSVCRRAAPPAHRVPSRQSSSTPDGTRCECATRSTASCASAGLRTGTHTHVLRLGQRVQPERDLGEDAEGAVGPGQQLAEVVAGDVLDDLAAGLGRRRRRPGRWWRR